MEIMVSVICNTYNHEKFIRDALDGIIMQKTDFPFEVLVHDDASTDGTADIIREYEAKYPDLIKPVYQTENQYSKNVKISKEYQFPRVQGKYIAYCEGDDYWTDPLKLQRQVDAMEAHPEVDICACCTDRTNNGEPYGKCMPADKDCIIPVEKIIEGGGDFVSTCSLVLRSEIIKNTPAFRDAFFYDYTLQIQGALRGGLLYLAECMATYRIFSSSSWTASYYTNSEVRSATYAQINNMLHILDEETDGKYSDIIKYKINENEFYTLNSDCRFREMLSSKYRDVYKKLSLKNRVKIYIRWLCPWLIKKRRQKKAEDMKKR